MELQVVNPIVVLNEVVVMELVAIEGLERQGSCPNSEAVALSIATPSYESDCCKVDEHCLNYAVVVIKVRSVERKAGCNHGIGSRPRTCREGQVVRHQLSEQVRCDERLQEEVFVNVYVNLLQ